MTDTRNGISLDDLAGGGKSWGGEGCSVGDRIEGEVVSSGRVQQTDFQSQEPLFWPNGDPRMMSKVTIQTSLSESDEDDGLRTIYLKGGNFEAREGTGHSGEKALSEAMKAAGLKTLDAGTRIQIAITGLSKVTTRGFQPAKLWKIKLTPAAPSAISADEFFND